MNVKHRVNREEFLHLLETVRPGLSTKDTLLQSSCFVLSDGWLITFNDEVSCRIRTDLPEDVRCAVVAAPLMRVLSQFKEDAVELHFTDSELKVKSGKRQRAGIRLEAEVVLPYEAIEKPSGWQDLAPEFLEGLKIVKETAGRNEKEFATVCIHIHPEYLESTDRMQASRYRMETGVERPFLVRKDSIVPIINYGMTRVAYTETWVHWKNKAGLIYSAHRYVEDYLKLDKLFEFRGTPASLPKGMDQASKLAEIFSGEDLDDPNVEVRLRDGGVTVRGYGNNGWAEEDMEVAYHGENLAFKISPKLLCTIVERHNNCQVSETRLRAEGENWEYLVGLEVVSSKEEADGNPTEETEPAAQSEDVGEEPTEAGVEYDDPIPY